MSSDFKVQSPPHTTVSPSNWMHLTSNAVARTVCPRSQILGDMVISYAFIIILYHLNHRDVWHLFLLKAHQFQYVAVWSHLRYNDSDYCSMIWLLLLSKRYATSVESWRKQKNFLSHDCKWFIAKKSNSPHLMISISHRQKPKKNN